MVQLEREGDEGETCSLEANYCVSSSSEYRRYPAPILMVRGITLLVRRFRPAQCFDVGEALHVSCPRRKMRSHGMSQVGEDESRPGEGWRGTSASEVKLHRQA